jgi:hypothetical protein
MKKKYRNLLVERMLEIQISRWIYHVHGLEDSIMLKY